MKSTIVIVSGYFNPIHKGHIEYFEKAKKYGEKLLVIVNNDFQRNLKGSKPFQNESERMIIVQNLRLVDFAFLSIDSDRTVNQSLRKIFSLYNESHFLKFANGGDQFNSSIPEKSVCEHLGIELIDGLGDKIQSSSWLLNMK